MKDCTPRSSECGTRRDKGVRYEGTKFGTDVSVEMGEVELERRQS